MSASRITLQQLLRLGFANAVIWLSDQPRNDIPIKWIVLSEDEIAFGDALLITGSDLTPKKVVQIQIRGEATIILWGEASFEKSAAASTNTYLLIRTLG